MKTKTINISLPAMVLQKIDLQAAEEYKSRSELLKEASLFYIQTKENWLTLQSYLSNKARKMDIKGESDVEKMVDSLRS